MSDADNPSPASPARARILLVDDDPMITELVVDMLGIEGYDVDTANNGIEALHNLPVHIGITLLMLDLDQGWKGNAAFNQKRQH